MTAYILQYTALCEYKKNEQTNKKANKKRKIPIGRKNMISIWKRSAMP